MGFSFGGLIQGALPVATGYYRGQAQANQLRRQYANEDADRERRMRLDALQEMLLKGQVDNFAADNARLQTQQGIDAKAGAEDRAIRMNERPPETITNDLIGPDGKPQVAAVPRGGAPRFLGEAYQNPVTHGGLGNRPIAERDPITGKITYRDPTTGAPRFTGQVSPKLTTNDERTAAGQAARLRIANEQMARFKPPAGFAQRWEQIRLQQGDNTNIEKVLPILTDAERAFMVAAINFGGTIGYLESGKALTIQEVKRLFNIIDLDNDGPESLQLKRQLRDTYVQSAELIAGRAMGSRPGQASTEPVDEDAVIDAVMDAHPEWDDAQVMEEVRRQMGS